MFAGTRLRDVYRTAPVFQSLHDPSQFEGRCGFCEYSALCGGSRARAYEATGDPLASDPFCTYQPEPKARINLLISAHKFGPPLSVLIQWRVRLSCSGVVPHL